MSLKKKIIAATPMLSLIAFLLLGFCANAWHPGWIVFFAIPIVPMLLRIDSFNSLYPLLTVIAYLVMGFVWNLWHPGWIIFLTIPVVQIFLQKKLLLGIFSDSNYSINVSSTTRWWLKSILSKRFIILRDITGQPKLPTVGSGNIGKDVVYCQLCSTTQRERRLELLLSRPSRRYATPYRPS